MSDLVLTAKRRDGKRVMSVYYDQDYTSPREDDNLGTMFCKHNRFRLGDADVADDYDIDNYNSFDELREKEFHPEDVVLPVFMLDHSGIALSTSRFSNKWDSGQLGFIYVTGADIAGEYGYVNEETRDLARQRLEAEVSAYSHYLNSDCYYYDIQELSSPCECCGNSEWVEVDSCGGWIGDCDDLLDEVLGEERQDYEVSY